MDRYYENDVHYLIGSSPYLRLMKLRDATVCLAHQVATGQECRPTLLEYPTTRIESLEFFYACLKSLGGLDEDLLEQLLTGWRGAVWGGFLALLDPKPWFLGPLRKVRGHYPHNDWMIKCAIAVIQGRRPPVPEEDAFCALAERCRGILDGVVRPRTRLRLSPTRAQRERMEVEREKIRLTYKREGVTAALRCIRGTVLGLYAMPYREWVRLPENAIDDADASDLLTFPAGLDATAYRGWIPSRRQNDQSTRGAAPELGLEASVQNTPTPPVDLLLIEPMLTLFRPVSTRRRVFNERRMASADGRARAVIDQEDLVFANANAVRSRYEDALQQGEVTYELVPGAMEAVRMLAGRFELVALSRWDISKQLVEQAGLASLLPVLDARYGWSDSYVLKQWFGRDTNPWLPLERKAYVGSLFHDVDWMRQHGILAVLYDPLGLHGHQNVVRVTRLEDLARNRVEGVPATRFRAPQDDPCARAHLAPHLLQAVLRAPDDIDARLAFADWLLAQGDPRGELINVQCALWQAKSLRKDKDKDKDTDAVAALAKREGELLKLYRNRWRASMGISRTSSITVNFERGFVECVDLNRDCDELPEALFRDNPVREVTLCRAEQTLTLGRALTRPLHALWLHPDGDDLPLERLFTTPYIRPLVHLTAWGGAVTSLLELDRQAQLRDLEELTIASCSSYHFPAVLQLCERLPQLRSFGVRNVDLELSDLEALLECRWMRKLRRLELSTKSVGDAGATLIASSPAVSELTHLTMNSAGIVGSARALVDSPHLRGLEHISLREHDFGEETTQLLVKRFGPMVDLYNTHTPY